MALGYLRIYHLNWLDGCNSCLRHVDFYLRLFNIIIHFFWLLCLVFILIFDWNQFGGLVNHDILFLRLVFSLPHVLIGFRLNNDILLFHILHFLHLLLLFGIFRFLCLWYSELVLLCRLIFAIICDRLTLKALGNNCTR